MPSDLLAFTVGRETALAGFKAPPSMSLCCELRGHPHLPLLPSCTEEFVASFPHFLPLAPSAC